MAVSYDAANNRITVTGYTEAVSCNLDDIHNADKAGTYSLQDRDGISAADGAPVNVTNSLRPADYVVLGGASNDLYIAIANWVSMTTATIQIIGTDRDGNAQSEEVVVNANGIYYTTKWFKTVTSTQVTIFTKSNGGSFNLHSALLLRVIVW